LAHALEQLVLNEVALERVAVARLGLDATDYLAPPAPAKSFVCVLGKNRFMGLLCKSNWRGKQIQAIARGPFQSPGMPDP
jgi:hypothetical protein